MGSEQVVEEVDGDGLTLDRVAPVTVILVLAPAAVCVSSTLPVGYGDAVPYLCPLL